MECRKKFLDEGYGIDVASTVSKESSMPAQPAPDAHASELLGSLTTEQQQRTSARVIKKLRLEPAHPDKRGETRIEICMVAPAAARGGRARTHTNFNSRLASSRFTSPVENHHDAHASEQLGSLTKEQEQRTSARVIKKLRLEPAHPDKRDIPECDTPIKIDEKDPLKFPTVKQRMPKALWSADEKSLFFEALNEYGKDFDAITAHICAKMKKKGMPDVNLKTKTQVSHFYYRTWHKLSKHVHFGENVKKVAQELYALINYGELRKKLVSVSEKTCARLHEMVLGGSMVVRHRGRNVRARTPMCRALRRLNQITDLSLQSCDDTSTTLAPPRARLKHLLWEAVTRWCVCVCVRARLRAGRVLADAGVAARAQRVVVGAQRGCALGVCSLTQVSLRARSGSSWARVAAARTRAPKALVVGGCNPLVCVCVSERGCALGVCSLTQVSLRARSGSSWARRGCALGVCSLTQVSLRARSGSSARLRAGRVLADAGVAARAQRVVVGARGGGRAHARLKHLLWEAVTRWCVCVCVRARLRAGRVLADAGVAARAQRVVVGAQRGCALGVCSLTQVSLRARSGSSARLRAGRVLADAGVAARAQRVVVGARGGGRAHARLKHLLWEAVTRCVCVCVSERGCALGVCSLTQVSLRARSGSSARLRAGRVLADAGVAARAQRVVVGARGGGRAHARLKHLLWEAVTQRGCALGVCSLTQVSLRARSGSSWARSAARAACARVTQVSLRARSGSSWARWRRPRTRAPKALVVGGCNPLAVCVCVSERGCALGVCSLTQVSLRARSGSSARLRAGRVLADAGVAARAQRVVVGARGGGRAHARLKHLLWEAVTRWCVCVCVRARLRAGRVLADAGVAARAQRVVVGARGGGRAHARLKHLLWEAVTRWCVCVCVRARLRAGRVLADAGVAARAQRVVVGAQRGCALGVCSLTQVSLRARSGSSARLRAGRVLADAGVAARAQRVVVGAQRGCALGVCSLTQVSLRARSGSSARLRAGRVLADAGVAARAQRVVVGAQRGCALGVCSLTQVSLRARSGSSARLRAGRVLADAGVAARAQRVVVGAQRGCALGVCSLTQVSLRARSGSSARLRAGRVLADAGVAARAQRVVVGAQRGCALGVCSLTQVSLRARSGSSARLRAGRVLADAGVAARAQRVVVGAQRGCALGVCSLTQVSLRARSGSSWARVAAAAHNPRAAAALPPRARLKHFIAALEKRWQGAKHKTQCKPKLEYMEPEAEEAEPPRSEENDDDLEEHLNLEPDRIIVQEQKLAKKPVLHLGPRPNAAVRLPVVCASEQLSSQKICFASYLQRTHQPKDCGVVTCNSAYICAPSMRRSVFRTEVSKEAGPAEPDCLWFAPASSYRYSQNICFVSYLQRTHQPNDCGDKIRTPKRLHKDSGEKEKRDEVEQKKPKLEDEPRLLNIDETAVDGIDLMANYKTHQRPKSEVGSIGAPFGMLSLNHPLAEQPIWLLALSPEDEEKPSTEDEKETKAEETAEEEGERDKYMSEREKDSFSEMEDDDKYIKSDSDNESDKDKGEKNTKFKNLKVKFRLRPKKCGGSSYTLVTEKDKDSDEQKIEESKDDEPDIDVDRAIRQIRKGWSVYDAGDLTIGDLYLMFGSRSKLELDYWWAEPTPPLSPPKEDKSPPLDKRAVERTPDKGTDSSVEDERERRESDGELFSPKAFGQDSNDGLSGDERKAEALAASPERKPARSLSLACKLINRPAPAPAPDTAAQGLSQLSDRLKRLLAMAGNPLLGGAGARCACGHSCAITRKQAPKQVFQPGVPGAPAAGAVAPRAREAGAPVFRHPTPIAPKPNNDSVAEMSLAGVPRWRRGRPRAADRQVVVQRLLPLLPKLPPPSNLIPVKIVPNSPPAPPRIMPKPPPTSTSDTLGTGEHASEQSDSDNNTDPPPHFKFYSLLSREALAASPERKPARSLSLACKLINRPAPAPAPDTAAQGLSQLSDRLKRLLAMAGNPLLGGAGARLRMRPLLRHHQKQAPKQVFQPGVPGAPAAGAVAPRAREAGAPVFRHPTPIAPKPNNDSVAEMSLAGVPRWRRGRPRAADRQVVVQRLLPLLPKLPPPSNLIPVKIVPNSPPAPPRIMPKPPPTSTSDLSFFYVLSESNGQFFFHDGDRRIPISPLNQDQTDDEEIQDEDTKEDIKMDITATEVQTPKDAEPSGEPSAEPNAATNAATNTDNEKKPADIANFLPAESLSLSPSRLLAGDGWLAGAVQDFSLSSFLGQLEPPQLAVDSHLQSLMAESSVDYVAKFADLAAEVTDERGPPN
ncbi:hypothetical protein MSG28_009059 [Choristoneura fumiferana]|uniref:Uncharacterized protein n=1 Tax=Choristoneura fumiferana TaxID=7141 RepID=A0ACC0KXB3_CHOFU|nr:hypothetical protein MSG28_009059 [Choristoneura fumiferana]